MEKKKVSKELVGPWLSDLRSGKYKQIKSQLQRGEAYCCIGVYCKTHNIEIINNGMSSKPIGDFHTVYEQFNHLFGSCTSIWELNDVFNKTFEEIANFVEENYELV